MCVCVVLCTVYVHVVFVVVTIIRRMIIIIDAISNITHFAIIILAAVFSSSH